PFFLYGYRAHPDLHSFPTRRSSDLGLLVAVTGVGTPVALSAATVHTFAHALFKATLFMLVGIIDREAGSRDIRELGGLRRVMPRSEEHTSELQSRENLVCRLLLEKK